MTKVYVLVEVGYEYNDETYQKCGCNYGGSEGTPIKVFADKNLAESVCNGKNNKRWKELNDSDEIRSYTWDNTDDMTDDEKLEYMKLHIPFYEVREVELEN